MILVGTSGWQYRDWRGVLYPEGLPQRRWLAHFSARFPAVEVNNSFYRLPTEETFVRWREESADGFTFAVKASRYITHSRRLREAEEPVRLFLDRARRLGGKLGPVLYQLPPRFPADLDRLEGFLRALPGDVRAAFEFRDRSWDRDGVRAVLDRVGAAWVLADSPGARVEDHVTGGWSYVRLHRGGHGSAGADYAREKLRRWADRIAALPARDVYVFFNNDPTGAAVRDARTLLDLLAERVPERKLAGPPGGDEAPAEQGSLG
ncbi:MAG: DUF72 domain-containing protein [Actinobacteria bacterium]|nr:DUF72 domain-containing protein [Actinomycetota bacterium]